MNIDPTYIFLILFLFLSYLDIRFKAIPSVILTSILIVALLLNPQNLVFGVASVLLAIMIKEILESNDLEFGIADLKVLGTIGLLIGSLDNLAIFFGIFAVVQLGYILLMKNVLKIKKETPFIPCLTFIYIILMIGGII